MEEKEIISKLEAEGYNKVWSYDAEPGEVDDMHYHEYDTKLHILSGEIRIVKFSDGSSSDLLLKKGDEIEILRDQPHSAKVGSEGCRYIVAEKY